MLGLMGKKLGMTQVFTGEGDIVPVTAVEVGPCTVVQKKTSETDGYNALQLGFGITRPGRMNKARRGHLEKKGLPLFTHLKEFRTEFVANFEVGQELSVAGFKPGDTVHVSGVSKGRGFQGVIKRHGKHGGPGSHGSDFHRRPGSIGMRTWPGHVLKNMKLPGHMGDVAVTTKNLEVVAVRTDDNVLLIKGAIPGCNSGMVVVMPAEKDFETRPELKSGGAAKKEEQPTA
ncbi:MAG: 50S ribosomal protein L3 [Pseudomonadota bacterium]